jgi:putative sterol carrier protein
MPAIFPSAEWLKELETKLNTDARYAEIAKNWEGDLAYEIEADDKLKTKMVLYLDLWHGKCRSIDANYDLSKGKPAFILTAPYAIFAKVLLGQLDPMQAMLTRKLNVTGSMAVMMRSVPTVLDFVRCAKEITAEVL